MKKVFVFLPDGVGLRNFAYTKFPKFGLENNIDTVYWNNTGFDLTTLGLNEIKIENSKTAPLSDIYKRAKIIIELKQNYKKTNDKVYFSYLFPQSYASLKSALKTFLVNLLVFLCNSKKGLAFLNKQMFATERTTDYYKESKATLVKEKPSLIFLTNQRPLSAIAPLLAAQDLGIRTATFIYSWDNLPKGMMVVKSDCYFVWSEHMKEELKFYYPEVQDDQIYIVGTPQFEMHYQSELLIPKEEFYKTYNLTPDKKYICFSGDDITTSPNDEYYLEDVAKAVVALNKKGNNIGIIYRKCPVDFTDRHKYIYEEYKNVITLIDPLWDNLGNSWNRVMPTKKDMNLLASTVHYTNLVINVGSSMAFDYAAQNKPCAFLNYDTEKTNDSVWKMDKIYKFVHFQSMPSKDAVLWINAKEDIESVIMQGLQEVKMKDALDWYVKICGKHPENSSKVIWKTIKNLAQ
ncbi:UDP-glycosyltransferase [Flavicella sediminum]|uniref:UDP-glycosyltransferase n=1 Tax=Flavicella sediminum TaxID=2585141 RepID=UPI001122090E|nr:UDP-glycosyltransferase [Flavicella sediminum]